MSMDESSGDEDAKHKEFQQLPGLLKVLKDMST